LLEIAFQYLRVPAFGIT